MFQLEGSKIYYEELLREILPSVSFLLLLLRPLPQGDLLVLRPRRLVHGATRTGPSRDPLSVHGRHSTKVSSEHWIVHTISVLEGERKKSYSLFSSVRSFFVRVIKFSLYSFRSLCSLSLNLCCVEPRPPPPPRRRTGLRSVGPREGSPWHDPPNFHQDEPRHHPYRRCESSLSTTSRQC